MVMCVYCSRFSDSLASRLEVVCVSVFVFVLCSVMPPRSRRRRATGPWENSQERSDKIEFKMEALLVQGYRCFSQAYCQAERMIDNKKWLRKFELNKIQAECGDECCDPKRIAKTSVRTPAQKLEYERERLAKQDNDEERSSSSRNATSSAILGSVNTTIPEAATKHSQIRRLLTLANKNPRSGEAATEHSEIPEAACQEAKRPRKSGKGNKKRARTPGKGTDLHSRTASEKRARTPGKGTDFHARTASPTPTKIWTPTPTEVPSDNEQIQ